MPLEDNKDYQPPYHPKHFALTVLAPCLPAGCCGVFKPFLSSTLDKTIYSVTTNIMGLHVRVKTLKQNACLSFQVYIFCKVNKCYLGGIIFH